MSFDTLFSKIKNINNKEIEKAFNDLVSTCKNSGMNADETIKYITENLKKES